MAFNKMNWKNKVVQYPNRVRLAQVATNVYDMSAEPGVVTENGTPINADNLNRIETGVDEAHRTLAEHEGTMSDFATDISNLNIEVESHEQDHNNPHNVTKDNVGLGNVDNFATATQTQAEAGSATNLFMTPATTTALVNKMTVASNPIYASTGGDMYKSLMKVPDQVVNGGGVKYTLKSWTPINLMGQIGGGSSPSTFQASQCTIAQDATNKVYGGFGLKITQSTGSGCDAIFDLTQKIKGTGKYYLATAYLKNGNFTTGMQVGFYCVGDAGYVVSPVVTDKTKFIRTGAILRPTDYDGVTTNNEFGNQIEMRVYSRGSSSQYGYVDNIAVYELQKSEYDLYNAGFLTLDQLVARHPFNSFITNGDPFQVKAFGKNIFNKAKACRNRIMDTTGYASPTTDATLGISDFMPVLAGQTYKRTPANDYLVAFYDINKVLISTIGAPEGVATSITPPTGAYYMRCNVKWADIDTLQIEQAATATTYEAYSECAITIPALKSSNGVYDTVDDNNILTQRFTDFITINAPLDFSTGTTVDFVKIARFTAPSYLNLTTVNGKAFAWNTNLTSTYAIDIKGTSGDVSAPVTKAWKEGYCSYDSNTIDVWIYVTKGQFTDLASASKWFMNNGWSITFFLELAQPLIKQLDTPRLQLCKGGYIWIDPISMPTFNYLVGTNNESRMEQIMNQLNVVSDAMIDRLGTCQRPLTSEKSVTYYLNEKSGSDSYDGLTPETAFQTFNKAFSLVPYNIKPNHQVEICQIGHLNQDVYIWNVNGYFRLYGSTGSAVNHEINGYVDLTNCNCPAIILQYLYIKNKYLNVALGIRNTFRSEIRNCKIERTGVIGNWVEDIGILVSSSIIKLWGNDFGTNRNAVAIFTYHGKTFSVNNSGTATVYGYVCNECADVSVDGTSVNQGANNWFYSSGGGQFRYWDGTVLNWTRDNVGGQTITGYANPNEYIFLGTLGGDHDRLGVKLYVGDWSISQLCVQEVIVGLRGGFGYWVSRGMNQYFLGRCCVVVYNNGGTYSVYLRRGNYYSYMVQAWASGDIYNAAINGPNAHLSVNNLLATTTVPSGTLVFDSCDSTTYPDNMGIGVMGAGDLVIHTMSTGNNQTASSTYTKVWADRTIGWNGSVRVKMSVTGTNAYTRIYKNDVAVGTERVGSGTFTEDIAVRAGDKLSIYGRSSSSSWICVGTVTYGVGSSGVFVGY